jgi:hypothetical protein
LVAFIRIETAVLTFHQVLERGRNRGDFSGYNTFQHMNHSPHRRPVLLHVLDAPACDSAGDIELLDVSISLQPLVHPVSTARGRGRREGSSGDSRTSASRYSSYLEEHDAEAVNVGLPRYGLSRYPLRSVVSRPSSFAMPKSAIQQYVLRLDVAVYDAALAPLVEVGQALRGAEKMWEPREPLGMHSYTSSLVSPLTQNPRRRTRFVCRTKLALAVAVPCFH